MNKAGKIIGKVLLEIVLLFIAIVSLLPFFWTGIMSTMPANLTIDSPPMIPDKYFMVNLRELLSKVNVLQAFGNSLFISTISVTMTVFFSALSAFAYAKYEFKGKKFLFMFTLMTMFMPSQLAWIGQIQVYSNWGILDSFVPFIIGAMGSAFAIIVIRGYIERGVPDSLLDAARIDGATDFYIFFRIVVPIIRPIIASMAIIRFIAQWNDYSNSLVILYSPEKYTLPLALSMLQSQYWQNYAAQSIGVLISLVPILTVYLILSRQFIAALTSGSVKE